MEVDLLGGLSALHCTRELFPFQARYFIGCNIILCWVEKYTSLIPPSKPHIYI
jgi:hypothetical protein